MFQNVSDAHLSCQKRGNIIWHSNTKVKCSVTETGLRVSPLWLILMLSKIQSYALFHGHEMISMVHNLFLVIHWSPEVMKGILKVVDPSHLQNLPSFSDRRFTTWWFIPVTRSKWLITLCIAYIGPIPFASGAKPYLYCTTSLITAWLLGYWLAGRNHQVGNPQFGAWGPSFYGNHDTAGLSWYRPGLEFPPELLDFGETNNWVPSGKLT